MSILSKLSIVAIGITALALIPTDTTRPVPYPFPMPPGGNDSGYESKYPKVCLTYDKTTSRDTTKAFKLVSKKADWLSFDKEKIGGLFSDHEKTEQYKDKTPYYEFISANRVVVSDITKTDLGEEELESACESLRDKLESNAIIFRKFIGKQSFTPVGMSDNVIFQIQDDMLTLFTKSVLRGNDYTLISISSHENESMKTIFAQADQAAKSNDASLILIDTQDWRNMKILNSLQVTPGSPTVHLLVAKDGTVHGRLDKTSPTVDELNEFIKSSLN